MKTLFIAVTVAIATNVLTKIEGEMCRNYIVKECKTGKVNSVWILEGEKWTKGDTLHLSKNRLTNGVIWPAKSEY